MAIIITVYSSSSYYFKSKLVMDSRTGQKGWHMPWREPRSKTFANTQKHHFWCVVGPFSLVSFCFTSLWIVFAYSVLSFRRIVAIVIVVVVTSDSLLSSTLSSLTPSSLVFQILKLVTIGASGAELQLAREILEVGSSRDQDVQQLLWTSKRN